MKKKIIVQIFLCAAFGVFGYLVSELIHNANQFTLPKIVQDNRIKIVHLSSSMQRNKDLAEFYLAWKNKEEFYGLRQIVAGFEGGAEAYWITQKGKLTLVGEDTQTPRWTTRNLKNLSIGYLKDGDFIEIDPEKSEYVDLKLTAQYE